MSTDLIKQEFKFPYQHSGDRELTIKQCIFTQCVSKNHGGCLFIENIYANLSISGTSFTNSHSDKHGGAFYADIATISMDSCTISSCFAGISGSYQSFNSIIQKTGNFHQNSIMKCGLSTNREGFSTLGIKFGESNASQFNISLNSIYSWGSGLSFVSQQTSDLYLSFSNFINNSQKLFDILCFHNPNNIVDLNKNNFIANNGSSKGCLFASISNSYINVRNSVMIMNQVGNLATVSDVSVVLFEGCFMDHYQDQSPTVHHLNCIFTQGIIQTVSVEFE